MCVCMHMYWLDLDFMHDACLSYLTNMMISMLIHFPENGKLSFF